MSEAKPAKLDPFSDLSSLVLDQDYAQTAGVKKLLRTVPVRKPNKQDFFRVHPTLRLSPAPLIELKDDREIYFVTRAMSAELPGEYFVATLYLAANRQGVVFLWPVRLPDPDGKWSEWSRSAADAAELGVDKYVRIRANMSLGAYEVFLAENMNIPDPIWPEQSFEEIIRTAFKDRFIDTPEHPVVKRLRGGM
jgi:hypothetical protein